MHVHVKHFSVLTLLQCGLLKRSQLQGKHRQYYRTSVTGASLDMSIWKIQLWNIASCKISTCSYSITHSCGLYLNCKVNLVRLVEPRRFRSGNIHQHPAVMWTDVPTCYFIGHNLDSRFPSSFRPINLLSLGFTMTSTVSPGLRTRSLFPHFLLVSVEMMVTW